MKRKPSRFDYLDTDYWDASPECRAAVRKARYGTLGRFSTEEIEARITLLEASLDRDYDKIQNDFFKGELDGKPLYERPYAPDLLLLLHEKYNAYKDATAKDMEMFLHLLCLAESKKGNFTSANEAYYLGKSYWNRKARLAIVKGGYAGGKKKHPHMIAVDQLVQAILKTDPSLEAPAVWERITTTCSDKRITVETQGGGIKEYYIYRKEIPERLDKKPQDQLHVQPLRYEDSLRDDGPAKIIEYNTFRGYVRRARKELKRIALQVER